MHSRPLILGTFCSCTWTGHPIPLRGIPGLLPRGWAGSSCTSPEPCSHSSLRPQGGLARAASLVSVDQLIERLNARSQPRNGQGSGAEPGKMEEREGSSSGLSQNSYIADRDEVRTPGIPPESTGHTAGGATDVLLEKPFWSSGFH